MKVSSTPLLVHGVSVTQVHQANERLYTSITPYLPTGGKRYVPHGFPQSGESLSSNDLKVGSSYISIIFDA